MRKSSVMAVWAAMTLLIGVLAGCTSTQTERQTLIMGAAPNPASAVMAQIYAGALRHAGAAVSHQTTQGTDAQLLASMDTGDVDLFAAFTGDLLAQLAPGLTPTTADEVYSDLNRSLPQGVSVGDATPVNATPEIFIATTLAASSGVDDTSKCAQLPTGLPLVYLDEPAAQTLDALRAAGCVRGPLERADGVTQALQRIASGQALGLLNGLDFVGDMASGPAGEVQALSVGESAVVGPRAQILVPVYRTAALSRDQVKAINKVAGEITTADLATLAARVSQGAQPGDLATDWLAEHGI